MYLWVSCLHSLFVGITVFAIGGKTLKKLHPVIPMLIMFVILAFLEIYWIPVFNFMNLEVYCKSDEIQNFFSITDSTNIVDSLKPKFSSVVIWLVETFLAYYFGKRIVNKISIK